MKNIVFCLLGLLLLAPSSPLISQETWLGKYNLNYYRIDEQNKKFENNSKNGLKELKVKNGSITEVFKYDEQGRVIEYSMGKKRYEISYESGILKKNISKLTPRGEFLGAVSFEWKEGLLQSVIICKANGEVCETQEKETYRYDSTFVVEYKYEKHKNDSFKEFRKNVYEYYPDHSYKKVTYYKNGKPKGYSVFDCNPRGIEQKAKKDSIFNCVKYDTDSLGNKIKVSITNQKGYSVKVVDYYNAKDERIASKTYDTKKGNPILWEYSFKPGSAYYIRFASYVRNKKFYEVKNTLDERDNCLESVTYKRGSLKRRNIQQFNEKAMLVSSNHYNRRNKLTGSTTYSYTYY